MTHERYPTDRERIDKLLDDKIRMRDAIDRLVLDMATARGVTPYVIRLTYGLVPPADTEGGSDLDSPVSRSER
ncbi:hypothetical protein [Occultella kanbiaonis]|uniref:hypothetical protein n=1 Tax=Occultella kanbiaonis TaxID=2675754 RepID=UPI0013D224B7|nr:hypothetical protein [Occultella kanbiaonis]